jgi:hypothetical protein
VRLDAPEGAPECNISAPACECGKALEELRGKVAAAIRLLDEGAVEGARAMLGALTAAEESS